MRIHYKYIFILLCFSTFGYSQVGRIEQNDRLNSWIDRYEIKYGNAEFYTGLSPKFRDDAYKYFSVLDSVGLSPKEEYDRSIILHDLSEYNKFADRSDRPWWKRVYENKRYMYEIRNKSFWISLNPILYLRGGIETDGELIVQNTRGLRLKGTVGKNIYFSSAIYENQASFQSYHESRINQFQAIPGQSLYKDFDFNISNSAYDYLNADGFVGLRIDKHFSLELGHGKNFVGHGIRSLILSNYATNYFYLRANTRFWKFNYQNLFTELTPYSGRLDGGDNLLSKKYMAQHVLSFKVNQRLELGIVETVIFERENHFEFQYLNPLIFYRAVEQFLDSADNIMIGLQGKYNVIDGYQLYGQLIVDEFNLNELRNDWNWFGNTIGVQAGIKAIDFLRVDHWDLQVELNTVRPYVYSHRGRFEEVAISPANFSHYSQPLAHPLGANFVELLVESQFRIGNKWTIHPRFIYAIQGIESTTIEGEEGYNVGSNILLDRSTKAGNNDQKLLQGTEVRVGLAAMNIYYELWPACFIDLNIQYRQSKSTIEVYNIDNQYIGLGIRTNFTQEYRDY